MNNGRFATSLHILTLLAFKADEWLSSEYIAGSININPVLVRKEISNLREAGLVESREGKNGGTTLALPPSKILLSDVYKAVRQEMLLGRTKNSPNPDCVIGRQINHRLDELYTDVEQTLVQKLGKKTLADFYKQFR
jgi:Rrf2 family protein